MCEHEHLRCTDGIFYCLDCGAKVDQPAPAAPEPEKPKRKTTTKKGAKA